MSNIWQSQVFSWATSWEVQPFVSVRNLCGHGLFCSFCGTCLEARLEEELIQEYHMQRQRVPGLIVDRPAKRHEISDDNDTEFVDQSRPRVAQVITVYHVKVEYRASFPMITTIITSCSSPNPLEEDTFLTPVKRCDWQTKDAVVHRSYAVPREIYYGSNPAEVVVLSHQSPLPGMLQWKLAEPINPCRIQLYAGVCLIVLGIGVPARAFILGSQQQQTPILYLGYCCHWCSHLGDCPGPLVDIHCYHSETKGY